MDRIVIDTNIFVSALLNEAGAPREVLRLALIRQVQPVFGAALFAEYEDVLARTHIFERCPLGEKERAELLDALIGVSEWTKIHFLWRPNLPDEADNHVIELAVAAAAHAIVTANVSDFRRAELVFPRVRICGAGEYLDWRRNR